MNNKQKSSYILGGVFIFAMLVIMIGISLFLINRTNSTLIEIYWKQGELVVESIAISAQQTVESVQLTSHQVQRHLKKIAQNIDSIETSNVKKYISELEQIGERQSIYSISIYDANGKIQEEIETDLYIRTIKERQHSYAEFTPEETDEGYEKILNTFKGDSENPPWIKTFVWNRKRAQGRIEIAFGLEKLFEVKYHTGLQIFIASLENRNIIKYITFLNEELKVIADTDPSRVYSFPDKLEYQDALLSDASYFFLNDDTMDIIQPFYLDHYTKGVFKIGFPTTEIDKIHRNTVRNTFIFSGWFMFLTIVITIVALRFQNVYLSKNEVIEKQHRENQFLVSLANLAAGVAHEVRNPLNSISMTIQRLQLEFPPLKEEDRKEYLSFTELMKKEVLRINSIITDFLGFSKPFKLDPVSFELESFLNEIILLFTPEATNKGVKVIKKVSLKGKKINGDQDKLNQVIINLLKNSLDASKEGGVIKIRSDIVKNKVWRLIIEDNGFGIPRDILDHIFDIYFTTKENGTGLGLYISRKIILAHKGSIQLQSKGKKGTKAVILLPIK